MTIINTQISSGGGQGGGDKVTALVGSNASGVSVGDKVILNYPAVNEKGYCSEYRFNNLAGGSPVQWTIFFGEYMMYVDTSGHPVFFKHDTIKDKLIYIKRLTGVTLPLIGISAASLQSDGTGATRITYNETAKRFAVCKDGTLTIYQAEIDDLSANVYPIWSASTLVGNGGIAQDSDTFWYMTTTSNLDSIVVKDFTYSSGTFVEGSAYTHTNTCPSFYPSGVTGQRVGFSPNLKWFALSYGDTIGATLGFCGMVVDKENKQITYGSSAYTVTMNNYLPRSSVFSLNNSGNGVIIQIYSSSLRTAYFTIDQTGAIENVVVQNQISNQYFPNISYAFQGYGIIHQTGDWVTGPVYPLNITSSGFSKIDYAGGSGAGLANIMIASLSSTGIFTYPYSLGSSSSVPYTNILTRWNNGAPSVGDTYLEPASELTNPFYFDGNYLYAQGGIYATNGGTGLTRIGNSTNTPSWRCPSIPLEDGSMAFGYGNGDCNYIYVKNGVITGSLGSSLNVYLVDLRLDSSRTGWAATCATTSNVSGQGIDYIENGSRKSYKNTSPGGGFLDKDGNAYMYYASTNTTSPFHIYSCTYNGGSGATGIDTTEIFTSAGLWNFLGGAYQYAAAVCDRIDNIHFWYKCNNAIVGFTKFDLTNLSITPLTTPAAIQQVSGTVYAAWWDLDNRLFIRTSTGLFVFAYTNHDISTMQLVKKFEWTTDYSGPATCSNDLKSYAVGNATYIKVIREADMPIYEFSANVYNGHNVASTSLTGFVNEAITTDPWGQSIVEVNTVKDPADTWTNVGTPFGFDVSTTSSDVSVGWGYYNSGSAEVIIPATVTKTIAQIGTNQTLGYKNDIYVYRDTSDVCSDLMCKTGATPVGTFKVSTALTTSVYLSPDKTVVVGTNADSGFAVSYEAGHGTEPNYTVVGSPTITDGVASGFSSSNYVETTTGDIGLGTEAVVKFKTGSSSSGNQIISGGATTLRWNSSTISFWNNNYSSWRTVFSTSNNTTYWLKIVKNGSTFTMYRSTDGENYTQVYSEVSNQNSVGFSRFGYNSGNAAFSGTIDLNECYVKDSDGNIVWKAYSDPTDGSVTVSDGYHYNNETDAPFYLDSDLTRSATQMVVHSEDFTNSYVEEQAYTVVGSPTITDRVASNFTTSNYLKGDRAFPSSGVCELLMKVSITSSFSSNSPFFCRTDIDRGAFIRASSSDFAFYDGGSKLTGLTPVVGKSYWLKYTINSSTLDSSFYGIQDNGYTIDTLPAQSSWTGLTWTSTENTFGGKMFNIGYNAGTNLAFACGSIDLDNFYIKQGDDIAWAPYMQVPVKQGTLFLTKPTATTTSTVVSANSSPTATYAGSVVTPVSLGKTVTMDTTLTKILSVDNA